MQRRYITTHVSLNVKMTKKYLDNYKRHIEQKQ